MEVASLLVFASVFLLCSLALSTKKKLKLPPGPKAFPLVGSLPFVMKNFREYRHKRLVEEAKTYGDVISVWIGGQLFVFLQGYKAIQEAFVRQADVFSARPNFMKAIQPMISMGKGVIWQNGHDWKIMRRFTLQTLRDFGVGKTSLEEKIGLEINTISNHFQSLNENPTEVKRLMTMAISNVIYGICFGNRYDYEDPKFHDILDTLDNFFRGSGFLSPAANLPSWFAGIVAPNYKTEVQRRNEDREKLKKFIYDQITWHEETYDPENIRDFIDLYIQAARGENQHEADVITKGNMFRVIIDLFLAGSETTSTTLDWCFLFLIEHPDVQQRCQQELDEVIGDREVRWSDRGKCTYVEATLFEIQRLANIAAFSVPHTTEKDAKIFDYDIPKNTIVVANLYSSHVDPVEYPEPHTFKPERFLTEKGKLVRKETLIPFSTGPRVCLGESLAKMELFLVFTNLLQRFTFHKESGAAAHDLSPRANNITQSPTQYQLVAKKRF